MANLRWKILTVLAVTRDLRARSGCTRSSRSALRHHPAEVADRQGPEARPRPEGRRAPRAARRRPTMRCGSRAEPRWSGCAERSAPPASPVSNIALVSPTQFKVEGVPPDKDAAFRQTAAEVRPTSSAPPASTAPTRSPWQPEFRLSLREEAVVQARETIERRVNELGVTEPSIAQQGANGDEILVQLPGVTDVNRAKEIIRSTGLLELKMVEQGPESTREAFLVNGQPPAGMDIMPGRIAGEAGATVVLPDAPRPRHRPRPAQRATVARREQSAGGQLHAEYRGRRKFGNATGANIGKRPVDRPRRPGAVGAADRVENHQRGAHFRQLHPGGSAEPVADPAVRLAAGDADLSRRANDRAEPRRRLDPRRRHRLDRRPGAGHDLHDRLLQAVGRERGRGAAAST